VYTFVGVNQPSADLSRRTLGVVRQAPSTGAQRSKPSELDPSPLANELGTTPERYQYSLDGSLGNSLTTI
jgi:hypothetical protein